MGADFRLTDHCSLIACLGEVNRRCPVNRRAALLGVGPRPEVFPVHWKNGFQYERFPRRSPSAWGKRSAPAATSARSPTWTNTSPNPRSVPQTRLPHRASRRGPPSHLHPQRQHPGPADGTAALGLPEHGRNLKHPPDTGHGHPADHGLHPVRGLRRAVADGCPHGARRVRTRPVGVVHRVGLRYIDVVRASGGKAFRFYLRPGLHGVGDEVFQPGQHLLHTESRGRTVVGGNPGTMVVRIVQNDRRRRCRRISWTLRRASRQGLRQGSWSRRSTWTTSSR